MEFSEKQIEQYTSLIAKRIESMEENWQQPWINTQAGLPRNLDNRIYDTKGINAPMLSLHTDVNGYEYPIYTTFLRAKEEGIKIQPGEKGILIAYTGFTVRNQEDNHTIKKEEYDSLPEDKKEEYKVTPYTRLTAVFNLDQTDIRTSRPDLWEQKNNEMMYEARDVESRKTNGNNLESMIQDNNWIIPIKHSSDPRAYYSPSEQLIHLPNQEAFKSKDHYYATALHEMAHSTEVPLKRDISNYGREELVAELSASIIASKYEYSKEIQDSNVQYLKGWLQNMKEDPSFLASILEDVHKTTNFISNDIHDKYKPIAEIGYLDNSGKVEYTIPFNDEEKFLKAIHENTHDGVPFTFKVLNGDKELEGKALNTRAGMGDDLSTYSAQEISDRENKQIEEVKEAKEEKIPYTALLDAEIRSRIHMYANPSLMTSAYIEEHGLGHKKLKELVQEREQLLLSETPRDIKQRELLEDKIREEVWQMAVYPPPGPLPYLPNREQKEALLSNYIEQVTNKRSPIDRDLLVDTATYKDIQIKVQEPNTLENRERLIRDDVEFIEKRNLFFRPILEYEARIRYREGWSMENTRENKEILSDLGIKSLPYGKDKLFIPSTEENIGELFMHTDKLMPLYGIGTLPKLRENSLQERLNSNPNLTIEDREALLAGRTVISPASMDSDTKKVYYIDERIHQLRTMDVKDLFTPKELSGVRLDEDKLKDLREGKNITFFDQENHVHYRAHLDMREDSNVKLEYKTALNEQFKEIPTVQSPDHEKERYVALKGAVGIHDIWGKEALKQERDAFLDKYDVQETYREFLLLRKYDAPGMSFSEHEAIKETIRQQNESIKEAVRQQIEPAISVNSMKR